MKPAHSPQEAHHTCVFSPAVHVVTIGFAVLPQCTATRSAPAKADVSSTLFHLSTTPSIPSDATYSTADLQYPHSSGVRLVLTCYST